MGRRWRVSRKPSSWREKNSSPFPRYHQGVPKTNLLGMQMLDDSPSFSIQRRNLMILSSIVLFAYLFGIDFPFIEKIGLSQFQVSIVLLVVIGYFVLRFYQTIEKQEK